ncbi:hypothetical protein Nepgr_003707 [Nepenthes gracilis]|uniref:Metallo-beta-lactamase domain-containing protein n=1 Tax=Nepenthes gracilis TaxID=150966 RepID=A0AAD3S010_NEPGR|nr:hypothetical protein Nepgr_003707 [Nepenthes gracilis]
MVARHLQSFSALSFHRPFCVKFSPHHFFGCFLSPHLSPSRHRSHSLKVSVRGSLSPPSSSDNKVRSHSHRLRRRIVSAAVSEENATRSPPSSTDVFKLTYLEANGWLWEVGGSTILVDPILVGNLDFGIPWLFDASKKVLKNFQLSDLPEVDCLLITNRLDDHCHLKTLKPLSAEFPNWRVISTPNAKAMLDPLFNCVSYLEPGQITEIKGRDGSTVRVRATPGSIVGPPWQCPENGYLVTSPKGQITLYYEPHCIYNREFLMEEQADIIVTPIIKQLVSKFTLVFGQEDAVKLAKLLRAKFIVPMNNGDLDSRGFLARFIQAKGTIESFKVGFFYHH